MPNTFDIPISMKTGSFNKLTSNMVLIADLNDSGNTKHGQRSYSEIWRKKKHVLTMKMFVFIMCNAYVLLFQFHLFHREHLGHLFHIWSMKSLNYDNL